MSARDAILGKVRKAVAATPEDTAARRAVVERRLGAHQRHPIPGRVAGKDPAALKALLRQHLETALVTVLDVATAADIPAAVARYLRDQNLPQRLATGSDRFIEELPWSREPALTRRVGRAHPEDEVSLSRAVAGVAETGTLALASGPDNPVTLTFLPETHIVIVEESAIVGPYENVWDAMRARYGDREMPRTVNFVSGPSRTADIGGKIVIGAHGPRRLCVLLVGSA
ncbi:MAG: LutC/YkgG family protein [Hyphomicrobiaceae bacterium]